MSKSSYKIPNSLDKSMLDHEIALSYQAIENYTVGASAITK